MSDSAATEPVAGRGSDRNYCAHWGTGGADEGHHMISRSAGQKVRYVEICAFCGWIDGEALDGYADNAIKEALTKRAQRIAVAIETEPFAFAQSSTEPLELREILYQALGAASVCWENVEAAGEFNSRRATTIGQALEAEVARDRDQALKAWSDLTYELYGLACNSQPFVVKESDSQDWKAAFVRLRDRFHELLPDMMPRLQDEAKANEEG